MVEAMPPPAVVEFRRLDGARHFTGVAGFAHARTCSLYTPAMRHGLLCIGRLGILGARVLALVALVACVSGCTPLATWPPTEGRPPLVPEAPPCAQLMATSVSFTRSNTNASAPLVFNLPPKTSWKVWAEVQRQLGSDARMMDASDPWAFTVQQVRLDGGQAEVDVAYRTNEGIWQMATVKFTGAFGGHYRPTYFQKWMIPVEAPTCNTPPPPPPKP